MKINLPNYFIRNIEGDNLFETFFISAVVSFLGIRFYLTLTGFPQIGGGDWHIAHVLWGGFLMLVALVLLFIFLGKRSAITASIFGGIGFGAFIDELGKFITADNNYFFQPSIALIYVVFVLLFLSIRTIDRDTKFTKQEYLINAIELLKEAVIFDLDSDEKKKAVKLLRKSDQNNPIVQSLTKLMQEIELAPPDKPNLFIKTKTFFHDLYLKMISTKLFATALISFFILQSFIGLVNVVSTTKSLGGIFFASATGVFAVLSFFNMRKVRHIMFKYFIVTLILVISVFIFYFSVIEFVVPELPFSLWAEFIFSAVSAILVIDGVLKFNNSRLSAYMSFKRAILVSIFLTQFFIFYREQLLAVVGLTFNILILITLQYMINEEKGIEKPE